MIMKNNTFNNNIIKMYVLHYNKITVCAAVYISGM